MQSTQHCSQYRETLVCSLLPSLLRDAELLPSRAGYDTLVSAQWWGQNRILGKWGAATDSNHFFKIFKTVLKDKDHTKSFISLTLAPHTTEVKVTILTRTQRPYVSEPWLPLFSFSLFLLFLPHGLRRKPVLNKCVLNKLSPLSLWGSVSSSGIVH